MNIIDERDVRTIHRKIKKKEYDDMITLSVSDSGQWVRLLDEGMVVYGDGSPWFYLMKGTLRNFYESLDESYVGSINIGHTDLATFPERIVGQWTKADLRLVDIGDGREALDVYLRLNEYHPLVKALRMAPFELGVSAEFFAHRNDAYTEQYGIDIVDGVTITDFGIVGDAGNVNSMGIRLKGETKMAVDLKQLAEALEGEGGSVDLEKVNHLLDEALETPEEVTEEVTEEATEETPEETPEEPEKPEETPEEAPEAKEAEEEPAEEEPEAEVTPSQLSALVDMMTDKLTALKAENDSLRAQLSARDSEAKQFAEKFQKLAVVLTERKETEEPKKEVLNYTDGIGEWK